VSTWKRYIDIQGGRSCNLISFMEIFQSLCGKRSLLDRHLSAIQIGVAIGFLKCALHKQTSKMLKNTITYFGKETKIVAMQK
jgi:hypothetical protein